MVRTNRLRSNGFTRKLIAPLLTVAAILSISTALIAATAQYDITFKANWSAATHPTDFPAGPHFSGLIGATHNASVQFWAPSELASAGIENMAETGSKVPLSSEVESAIAAGTADSVISGGGISVSPGTAGIRVEVSEDFPLVSLVSMIAPSPDWFVGVHDFSLRTDGQWIGKSVVELWPYDAGTDDGVTFSSRDIDANPRAPIAQLSGFPFEAAPPLGQFTFLRILPGDYNQSGTLDASDVDILTQAIRVGQNSPKFDVDQNGVVDSADRRDWIKSLRGTFFGDADLDGQFNSSDLIAVSQAGEYEDDVPANSSWATGDWSGDGEFDSTDLIRALEDGGYELAPAVAVRTVPEPHPIWPLIVIAVATLRSMHGTRRAMRQGEA